MTYSIDAQALGEHSGRVAQCASGVHEGASAAETTIDGSAFGVLRSPIALPVGLVDAIQVEAPLVDLSLDSLDHVKALIASLVTGNHSFDKGLTTYSQYSWKHKDPTLLNTRV